MKRLNLLFYGLICLFFVTETCGIAQVTPAATVTGNIFAEIIPVFSAKETSQMSFGKFSPGPQGGQIILTPANSLFVRGSVFKCLGSYNAASFFVTGDIDAAFAISLPTEPVVLKHISSSKTIKVTNWMSIPEPGIGSGLLQNGSQTVTVGAILKLGPYDDNPVGIYRGIYSITFDFN